MEAVSLSSNERMIPERPILVVDDEEHVLTAFDTALRVSGFNNVITCRDSREVMGMLFKNQVEVLLLDLIMPNIRGEELLSLVRKEYPEIPVIIITGSVDVETAVNCMKEGTFDYVVKPVEEVRLIGVVKNALRFRGLKRENEALKECIISDDLKNPAAFAEIITDSRKMLNIFQYIESIAGSFQPVLITGETGTGKELIARAVHNLGAPGGPFLVVDVAGLDDNMFSDTLFGHAKGAFTGAENGRSGMVEKAAGGTLFLDEIGDLNINSQVKLLRLIEKGEYLPLGREEPGHTSARFLAATNRDVTALQREGKFRKDLAHRLCTHHIHVPPLRERKEDIPLLIKHFMDEASTALGKKKPVIPGELVPLLEAHNFPGNIRELRAMVFDALSRHKSGTMSLNSFKSRIASEGDPKDCGAVNTGKNNSMKFPARLPTLKQSADMLIAEAMKRSRGNQSVAAMLLGISQQALSKRLKKSRPK